MRSPALSPNCGQSTLRCCVTVPDCAVLCCAVLCPTEMELRVPDTARVSAWVCFDGKARQELHHGDSVFIKMSENPVPTINRTDLTTDW